MEYKDTCTKWYVGQNVVVWTFAVELWEPYDRVRRPMCNTPYSRVHFFTSDNTEYKVFLCVVLCPVGIDLQEVVYCARNLPRYSLRLKS